MESYTNFKTNLKAHLYKHWNFLVAIPFMAALTAGFVVFLAWNLLRPQSYLFAILETRGPLTRLEKWGNWLAMQPPIPSEIIHLPVPYNWWDAINMTVSVMSVTWIAVAIAFATGIPANAHRVSQYLDEQVWKTLLTWVPPLGLGAGVLAVLMLLGMQPTTPSISAFGPAQSQRYRQEILRVANKEDSYEAKVRVSTKVISTLDRKTLRDEGTTAWHIQATMFMLFGMAVSYYLWGFVLMNILRRVRPELFVRIR